MKTAVGIRSVAMSRPGVCRTNAYWRKYYPGLVEEAEGKALSRLWSSQPESTPGSAAFDAEMEKFANDPFWGARQRWVLGPGETGLHLEVRAAREAMRAAGLAARDVDLLIACSFLPEQVGPGNAVFLARELALTGAAWNMESACAVGIASLQTAAALVRDGQYRNVLVVVGCTYSRVLDDTDTMSWMMGDGAGAFVVGPVSPGTGLLAAKSVHTSDTCGAASYEALAPYAGEPVFRFRAGRGAGRLLRDAAGPTLMRCCRGAADAASVSLNDIDFFVFNTPTAWFAPCGVRALRVDPARAINPFPMYTNIGPALTPTNLWLAATEGCFRPGDLVMLYAVGSVSSAGAAIVRWGDVALGAEPIPARFVDPEPPSPSLSQKLLRSASRANS
jgi:3-oxoacyl-[acyl-carrier-protein] synthase-3